MIVLLTIYIERMNNKMRFRAGDLDDRPRYIPVVQQRFTDRHNRWPYDHSRIYWYVRSITLSWFNHPSIQNSELEINKLLSKDGRFGYKLSCSLPITWYFDDPPFFFYSCYSNIIYPIYDFRKWSLLTIQRWRGRVGVLRLQVCAIIRTTQDVVVYNPQQHPRSQKKNSEVGSTLRTLFNAQRRTPFSSLSIYMLKVWRRGVNTSIEKNLNRPPAEEAPVTRSSIHRPTSQAVYQT